jgi:superfamily I DNA and RNA helicase
VQRNYVLSFNYPTQAQIDKIRRINRDISDTERRKLEEKIKIAEEVLRDIESGDLPLDALSSDAIEQLKRLRPR